MKKFTIFVCALATAVASFATIRENSKAIERPFTPNIHFAQAELATDEAAPGVKDRLSSVAVDTLIAEYVASYSFNSGTPSSGIGYVNEAQIITPYRNTMAFENYYGLASDWYVDDELVASDTSLYVMPIGEFGAFPLPVMKTPLMPTSDTTAFAFIDYQFGAFYTSIYAQYGFENYINVAPASFGSLTKCRMYTEQQLTSSGKSTYGSDWTFVTAGSYGSYSYGTKLINPWLSDSANTRYMDTIVALIQNPTYMYIDHVSLGVFTMGNEGVKSIFPGENDHVRLTLYPLTATGIDWANPIASAIADTSNYIGASSASSWYGMLEFNFTDVDPVTGAVTEVPAIAEGSFAAVLDEFNEGTADFGIITDYYTDITGDSYFAYTDTTGNLNLKAMWRSPSGLLLNFYAYLPAAVDVPELVVIEATELTKTFAVKTNTYAEDFDFDAPEWLSVEAETVYDENEDHTYVVNITLTAEEADEAREGAVIITDDFSGYQFGFAVKQDVTEAIDNVYFKTNNKSYDVLGREVNEDYKGIIIRNGEKIIR